MRKFSQEKKLFKFNGLAIAVGILRNLDTSFKDSIQKSLKTDFPALAKIAAECEFLYKDLARLQTNSLIRALNTIEPKALLNAWKLTTPELQGLILSHMSKQRQADFLQLAKTAPPIPKHSILKAQTYIAKTILAGLRKGNYKLKSQI